MPYADPEKRKAVKRAYYVRRYQADPKFREAEIERTMEKYRDDPEVFHERVRRYRAGSVAA